MKKENLDYFKEFATNIGYAVKCAEALNKYITEYDYSKALEHEKNVHTIENEADKNLHKIIDYLIKDFLPPIDREDIIMLSHRIDDVVDNIDDVVINLNIYDIKTTRNDVIEFTALLLESTKNLKNMLESLSNKKNYEEVIKMVIKANQLEENGDILYQKAIKDLIKTEQNPLEIIKWTKIYECLENALDACENVGNCVSEIILKEV